MTINNWNTFLHKTGATHTEHGICFAESIAHEAEIALNENCLADLSHLALISVCGLEAEKFLQGQLTCDVREVNEQQSSLGAHCNPKGRIISNFRLFRLADTYYLQLPSSMLDIAQAALRKYALFSKVTLTNASDELIKLGTSGPTVESVLQKQFGSLPSLADSAISHNDILIIRLPGHFSRFELVGNYTTMQTLWRQLAETIRPIGHNAWNLLDIVAGIPSVYPSTSELFTPHQLNYPLLKGVSFQKGCYTGQEVIARMHYLGKLKQHMYRAETQSQVMPQAGSPIYMEQAGEKQQIGEVVMAAKAPHGYQMLITMQDKGVEQELWLDNNKLTLDLMHNL